MHSAAGRRLGLCREEINDLAELREDRFERREWIGLRVARATVMPAFEGDPGTLFREFEALYSKNERAYVLKFVRMMDFFNTFGNLFIRVPWKRRAEGGLSCPMPGGADQAGQ